MPRRPFILIAACALAAALGACDGRAIAPDERGVCWQTAPRPSDGYVPLANDVASLEVCAMLLEAQRLQGKARADGAFQGYFIFVSADEISSASHVGGWHYPILQPPQRVAIDQQLLRMIRQRGGRAPDASELHVEHQ